MKGGANTRRTQRKWVPNQKLFYQTPKFYFSENFDKPEYYRTFLFPIINKEKDPANTKFELIYLSSKYFRKYRKNSREITTVYMIMSSSDVSVEKFQKKYDELISKSIKNNLKYITTEICFEKIEV